MKNNNIEKDIYNSPTVKESIKLASETMQEEKKLSEYMDMLYEEGLEKFKKEAAQVYGVTAGLTRYVNDKFFITRYFNDKFFSQFFNQ